MKANRGALAAGLLSIALLAAGQVAAGEPLREAALDGLTRAGDLFRETLGRSGGYVWDYSADGGVRRGEGKARPGVAWIQPPGTPAVGAAFLRIHEVTGAPVWLDGARDVAALLLRTQLLSGGWYYSADTDPAERKGWCYRVEVGADGRCQAPAERKERNRTVLDDNTTQAALDFLMWYDRASGGVDPAIHEAVAYGLSHLIEAQYANGGFFPFLDGGPPEDAGDAERRATVPETWSRAYVKTERKPYYVVNDNLPRDTGRMFLRAFRQYGDPAYRQAAERIGHFLRLAQLPEPQAGWAQGYDSAMQPAWGRRFEPPAVASSETGSSIEYLLELFGAGSDRRNLDAALLAAQWLERVRLPDGHWARFYELGTDRPIYVDNDNVLTATTDNPIDHYSMSGDFRIPVILARLRAVAGGATPPPLGDWASPADDLPVDGLSAEAGRALARQDELGAWRRDQWVDGRAFEENVFLIARYLDEAGEAAGSR